MFGKYKVVLLIGTTRNHQILYRHIEHILTVKGYIVLAPVIYNLNEYIKHKDMIDDMCDCKFEQSDALFIATPSHIGESTRRKIYLGIKSNKEILMIDSSSGDIKTIHSKDTPVTDYDAYTDELIRSIEGEI